MTKILNFLRYASKRYYEGSPIISDEEFDSLVDQSGYSEVGHQQEDGIQHCFRMYSQQKYFKGESTQSPLKASLLVETPKLDGAAVALTYINGVLKVLATRGNGTIGQDISHLIPAMDLPLELDTEEPVLQITGEVVAPSSIPNARNYAAGALNLKSVEEFKTRDLTFVAYGVQPFIRSTYMADMRTLVDYGFITVFEHDLSKFPKDGIVYRLNDNKSFEEMGFTAHHPRGAYALKERKLGIVTTLLDVIWQVGRSGVVSPVAILDPIDIDGATVSRATLHNMQYIDSLGLEIGCQVEVIRSGDIIPRIVRRVN